jgi:hypothetical protein
MGALLDPFTRMFIDNYSSKVTGAMNSVRRITVFPNYPVYRSGLGTDRFDFNRSQVKYPMNSKFVSLK